MFVYLNVIRVDGASGRALMLVNRQGGDTIHPIGLFAASLSPAQTTGIAAAIDGIKWADVPPPRGGDISAAMLALDYAHGSRIIQRSFNARNGEFLQAISPVMTQIDNVGALLLGQPMRAIDASVVRTAQGFKLVVRNIGTGPLMISDPRAATGADGKTCGMVEVAERKDPIPGTFSSPPTFRSVPLQPLGDAPASLVLGPGQKHVVETVVWTPPHPGRYFAHAHWKDYDGPKVDPKKIMPLIPDPAAAAADARPYVIRGAVFSESIKFDVEDRR